MHPPRVLSSSVLLAAAVAAVASLSACGSAGKDAAQAAYDACVREDADAETQLLFVDGKTVSVEIKGENAKALSGSDEEVDAIASGEEPEGGLSGLDVAMAMVIAVDCLVEETNFPGSSDDLRDGDEWDGWKFEDESGAGMEGSSKFTSTL